MNSRLRIAVCGCGPAGLAAALLLKRSEHDVTIFERFADPQPVGSGLILQPTGLAVLAELNLLEQILQRGTPIDRLFGRVMPSRRIALDVRYNALGLGWRAIGVHRAALFDVLHEQVRRCGIDIQGNSTITGSIATSSDIGIDTASGKRLTGFDIVIDALGANSSLTQGRAARIALEYGALWVNVPWPSDGPFSAQQLEQRYFRAQQMCGVLPIGSCSPNSPRQAAFFWSLKRAHVSTWKARGLDAWRNSIHRLWPEAATLVAHLENPDDITFAQYDHFTQQQPCGHRVAHIGDSAHATSPQLGQGANMALLDALAIARALERNATVTAALHDYARMRRWHVRLFQLASRIFTPFYQSDSHALALLRDWITVPLARMPIGDKIVAKLVTGMTVSPLRDSTFNSWRFR